MNSRFSRITYIFTDQQGNARMSFQNNAGAVKITQENSYYAFGEQLAGGTVAMPATNPNKNLYNGGSEWQNDLSGYVDYYQTFYRNYDPATARFTASDPMAESTESLADYQYAANDPVNGNDPAGNKPIPNPPPFDINAYGQMIAYQGGEGNYMTDQFNVLGGDPEDYDPWDPIGAWAAVVTSPQYQAYLGGLSNSNNSAAATIRNLAGQTAGALNDLDASQAYATYLSLQDQGDYISLSNKGFFYWTDENSVVNGEENIHSTRHHVGFVDDGESQNSDPYAYAGNTHIGRNGYVLPPAITTDVQFRNMCFLKIMEWVSRYYHGSLTAGNAALSYARSKLPGGTTPQLLSYATDQGVDSNDIGSLLSQYFKGGFILRNFNNIAAQINLNNPVMAFLNEGNNVGHEVMITGYGSSGLEFVYFDPELGTYKNALYTQFNSPYVVTGIK